MTARVQLNLRLPNIRASSGCPSMDRLWIEGAEGRRRFLDRITLSFFPKHAENTLRYEKSMRERNRLLKDQVRDPHWYKALERQMAEAGAAINTAREQALNSFLHRNRAQQQSSPAGLELQQTEVSCPKLQKIFMTPSKKAAFGILPPDVRW